MNKKLLNTQIKSLTIQHGAEIVNFYKDNGFNTGTYTGENCEHNNNSSIYYGVDIDGRFSSRSSQTSQNAIQSSVNAIPINPVLTTDSRLNNLDTTISSRNAVTPPTVVAIRNEMDSNSTKLANLDATISSRMATFTYTAPDNTSIAAIKAKTDTIVWGDITSIKTKTDTIVWSDVTGLVITSGLIKTKTDTIDWTDIVAIQTKTDTITWGDITAIGTTVSGIEIRTDLIPDNPASIESTGAQIASYNI